MKKRMGWWVDIADDDGSKRTIGPFTTYEEASNWIKYTRYSIHPIYTIEYRATIS